MPPHVSSRARSGPRPLRQPHLDPALSSCDPLGPWWVTQQDRPHTPQGVSLSQRPLPQLPGGGPHPPPGRQGGLGVRPAPPGPSFPEATSWPPAKSCPRWRRSKPGACRSQHQGARDGESTGQETRGQSGLTVSAPDVPGQRPCALRGLPLPLPVSPAAPGGGGIWGARRVARERARRWAAASDRPPPAPTFGPAAGERARRELRGPGCGVPALVRPVGGKGHPESTAHPGAIWAS